ncbi:uncharacterized protein F4822DRAFT_246656 [Hypoxylon trugodes]|uniref:uncharacterized protein n=1 Tax=Hypoxylon trugodes TaxID=326681 RepID=UPI0021912D34|nr:uncharacterized protein F4822DRAFT_246656 [Hypoxylon trugodes]KAI1388444.1 hypothetical protein F4822DRAFT_246656 [Hypoxylon trugodes]
MSRYEDAYSRGRSSHYRDRSSEYKYSGDTYPVSYEESRRLAEQENLAYDDEAPPQKLLTYEPHTPFYPPQSPSNLDVPELHSRPRSLPPFEERRRSTRGRRRERRYNKDSDSEDSDDERARTPLDKARNFVDNTFTNSTAGLGIGVLGALVGGLAVREAVDATSKHNNYNHEGADYKRNQLIGTVVGAAVGALGANAVEKRLEVHRERDRIKQDKWDRKFRPDADVVEKREVMARPHSSSVDGYGWKKDWDPWDERSRERDRDRTRARSHAVEREVDPDARSWKNVEDWLYDERNDARPRSRGADDDYRY